MRRFRDPNVLGSIHTGAVIVSPGSTDSEFHPSAIKAFFYTKITSQTARMLATLPARIERVRPNTKPLRMSNHLRIIRASTKDAGGEGTDPQGTTDPRTTVASDCRAMILRRRRAVPTFARPKLRAPVWGRPPGPCSTLRYTSVWQPEETDSHGTTDLRTTVARAVQAFSPTQVAGPSLRQTSWAKLCRPAESAPSPAASLIRCRASSSWRPPAAVASRTHCALEATSRLTTRSSCFWRLRSAASSASAKHWRLCAGSSASASSPPYSSATRYRPRHAPSCTSASSWHRKLMSRPVSSVSGLLPTSRRSADWAKFSLSALPSFLDSSALRTSREMNFRMLFTVSRRGSNSAGDVSASPALSSFSRVATSTNSDVTLSTRPCSNNAGMFTSLPEVTQSSTPTMLCIMPVPSPPAWFCRIWDRELSRPCARNAWVTSGLRSRKESKSLSP